MLNADHGIEMLDDPDFRWALSWLLAEAVATLSDAECDARNRAIDLGYAPYGVWPERFDESGRMVFTYGGRELCRLRLGHVRKAIIGRTLPVN